MTSAISRQELTGLVASFMASYDADDMDRVWEGLSLKFIKFWRERISENGADPIPDSECDEIIRILDRNGKGNTRNSESVARAMVPQGAWRRMFNQFRTEKELRGLVWDALAEREIERKAARIDDLYRKNAGQRNNLTGPSGNTIGAFLAVYDPVNNLSIISLNDRRAVIEFLGLQVPFDWETASAGIKIAWSNKLIIDGMRELGMSGSARTVTRFFYSSEVQPLWKGVDSVKRTDKSVTVTIPTEVELEDEGLVAGEELRESMQMQALIARMGARMGFAIWLPKADRSRVLKAWNPSSGELLDELPLGYDATTMKTIEQIDVLWMRKRTIVRAFEVEHTTSVYSGLLRMADLIALQPNIDIKLHIVAPAEKRGKVLQELRRPVFSLLEGRALAEMCTYLSYDNVKELGEHKHLEHLSDNVIGDYEEVAE